MYLKLLTQNDSFNIRLDDWKKNSSGLEECSEENTQNEAWVTKGTHIEKSVRHGEYSEK